MTAARDEVTRKLHHGADPFAGFISAGWEDPTDEWDSHHPWFDQAVAELRPWVIVEVGSFLGASARHFAAALARERIDGVVVCVDTWLGETVLNTSPQWRPHLRHANGRPEVYRTWLANALAADLQDFLCPLPMDSRAGARYLAHHGVAAQVVYLDGSHEAGDVYQDLCLYWDLVLAPGGVLLADDLGLYPAVSADLARFAGERVLAVETHGLKARLRKD